MPTAHISKLLQRFCKVYDIKILIGFRKRAKMEGTKNLVHYVLRQQGVTCSKEIERVKNSEGINSTLNHN